MIRFSRTICMAETVYLPVNAQNNTSPIECSLLAFSAIFLSYHTLLPAIQKHFSLCYFGLLWPVPRKTTSKYTIKGVYDHSMISYCEVNVSETIYRPAQDECNLPGPGPQLSDKRIAPTKITAGPQASTEYCLNPNVSHKRMMVYLPPGFRSIPKGTIQKRKRKRKRSSTFA